MDQELTKKQISDEVEKVEAMGQENETKASKWVIEENKEVDTKEKKRNEDMEWKLAEKRKTKHEYREAVLEELFNEMKYWQDQLPKGWKWGAKVTDKGMELWIKDGKGDWHAKGMGICGEAKYDLNGMQRLVQQALNYCDTLVGVKKDIFGISMTESGIVLPS